MYYSFNSNKVKARIAGAFYLLVGIFGGFAEGFVDPKLYGTGNAAESVGNILSNIELVRFGVIAHLLDGTFFVFTAMMLYNLLQFVNKNAARAMLILVIIATGILCINTVFLFESLQVATNASYSIAFGIKGSYALVLLLLDMQHYGTLIAQVFFGLWLIPLGFLVYKSKMFPVWLGYLLIAGGICYISDLLTAFLFPSFTHIIHGFIIFPCAIAEILMVFYLLFFGVKTQNRNLTYKR